MKVSINEYLSNLRSSLTQESLRNAIAPENDEAVGNAADAHKEPAVSADAAKEPAVATDTPNETAVAEAVESRDNALDSSSKENEQKANNDDVHDDTVNPQSTSVNAGDADKNQTDVNAQSADIAKSADSNKFVENTKNNVDSSSTMPPEGTEAVQNTGSTEPPLRQSEVNSEVNAEDDTPFHTTSEVKPPFFGGNNTFEIVSTVGYLIGVAKEKFERDYSPLSLEVYNKLEHDKNARIVRNLCIIRTRIEQNYKYISSEMRTSYRTILSMPEYIPSECLTALTSDGVYIYKSGNKKLNQHIIEINKNISNRINNCKNLFGSWIKWDYIKELFIMPNGLEEIGTAEAADVYYKNKSLYPYQMYINWVPQEEGNILANDKKFMTLLYKWHGDYFNEFNKVSDAGDYVKTNIHDFMEESRNLVLIVDCENSDPYKLCATLRGLGDDDMAKLSNIILVDDVHTATAWQLLENYVSVPVERIVTERIKENKSIVDAMFMVRACKEHYKNHVDSFIIVSSDSDYWPLIKELNDAKFLVMVERDKCGPDMKDKLIDNKVFYCHIDDFYSGNIDDIRNDALMRAAYRYLKERISFNANDMLDSAIMSTRIEMNEEERKRFFNKHIKPMTVEIDDDGSVSFRLKN